MNKRNAHLYLPLVQALADGKTLQSRAGDCGWHDLERNFSLLNPPDFYRIKPATFPPKPEGMEWNNPDGLTAEQVGDGWRLLTSREMNDGHFHKCSAWIKDAKVWDSVHDYDGDSSRITYRVPLSTPYPDGSYVKDGQLVKPWVPKFKVGDRVRRMPSDVFYVAQVLENGLYLCQDFDGERTDEIGEDYLIPEPEKRVPLEPSDWMKDGPWWIAPINNKFQKQMIVEVTDEEIFYREGFMTHTRATEYVRSNDGITWVPCHKPA